MSNFHLDSICILHKESVQYELSSFTNLLKQLQPIRWLKSFKHMSNHINL